MPTVSVDLDSDLHDWLAERARTNDRTVAAELKAVVAAVRAARNEQTLLPVGIYTDKPSQNIERKGSIGEDPDLPIGVFDESTDSGES